MSLRIRYINRSNRHGQWDYGNKWTMSGCEGGNCLRSHVGLGETYNTLVMITKAGVPSHKITVGISSYGRQFRMTDPSCSHANCTFVGPASSATPGRCTETPEYISNAEINEIIRNNPSAKVKDMGDNSKVMTYDGNWVSFMNDHDKVARTNLWKSMKFGGVTEWAVDLNTFDHDSTNVGSNKNPSRGTNQMRGGGLHEKASIVDTCVKDGSWKEVRCTTRGISDRIHLPPDEIWSDVKADAAWCAALNYWRPMRNQVGVNFTDVVSFFLRGIPEFHCQLLIASNGCTVPDECRDLAKDSAAAMQVILLSIAHISGVRL
jgi:hypothetical protein